MELMVKMLSPWELETQVEQLPAYSGLTYKLKPFDPITLNFFETFSKSIFSNPSINRLPEISALGFWLRRPNLASIKTENASLLENRKVVVSPLGRVFHICPANVDTMFVYSLTISVLMGNKNVLRVSKRMRESHIDELFKILNAILQLSDFVVLQEYINIISYDHNDEISTTLSQMSNARVIWGGDQTIQTFKKFTSGPRTKDIIFADRISMLCIRSESYLALDTKQRNDFAKVFFNDAYTFDQMGCSSPQTIYLVGSESSSRMCMLEMVDHLGSYVQANYKGEISSLASLKLNQILDDSIDGLIVKRTGNNYLTFLELAKEGEQVLHHGCGGGYFYVQLVESVSKLLLFTDKKVQTISYFGLTKEDKDELAHLANGEGIDRVVPLGQALSFSYIWDGYNLIEELSRKCFFN